MKNTPNTPARSGVRILFDLIQRYPRLLWSITILAFLSSLVGAPVPYLAKIIIDDLIFRGSTTGDVTTWLGVSHTVWMIAAIVLLGVLLKLLSSLLGGWQSHYILQITRNSLYETRLDAALTLMGGQQKSLEKLESSRIASRLGFDVNQMDTSISTVLRNFLTSIFLVVIVVSFMLFLNVWLTLILLGTMPLTAALTVWSYRKLQVFSLEESDRVADLNVSTTETFAALRVIRTFCAESFFLNRFMAKAEALRFEGLHHWTRFNTINLLLVMLSSLGGDIFLLVGGVLAIQGQISFGSFFAFYAY
ncbi:MAG: ABC transporter ATP-binding protein, partial [Verrucomicrobiae bacterium]